MHRIELPQTERDAGEVLISCLNPPPQTGIVYKQILKRLPIARKLEAANTHVLLEDAEWEELKGCVEATQWTVVEQEIAAICAAVVDAQPAEDPPAAVDSPIEGGVG